MKLTVIIPAAGASTRYKAAHPMGEGRSKLDEDLGGRPVLHRTVELFTDLEAVRCIIVAGPADGDAFEAFKLRHGDKLALFGVQLVRGGATHRHETVQRALAHVPADATHVAVHDGARPCTPGDVLSRVLDAAGRYPAVIPALDVGDTIKRATGETREAPADPLAAILTDGAGGKGGAVRVVGRTLDRAGLLAVQTPQVFERSLLERAYAQDDLTSTDDAQLVERLGEEVVAVEGDAQNAKITRPADLIFARAVLGFGPPKDRPSHKRF